LVVRALEDYGPRYGHSDARGGGGPSNAARYVIEGHVRDASAQDWDWDWDYHYLLENPDLLGVDRRHPCRAVTLRVTQIYRRENGDRKIVHRHGDHLPTGQSHNLPGEASAR
jgi:hypothetical protein